MKRIVLFVLLAGGMGMAPQETQARHWRAMYGPGYGWYGAAYHGPAYHSYRPAYDCGFGGYSMPAHYAPQAFAAPAGKVVEVGAYDGEGFKPKSITVAPGTTVRWVNHGKEPHTVTARDGRFDSGKLSPGATYSVTFTQPGTFEYFCRPHEKMGMMGTVVVESGGGNGSDSQVSGSSY
jgi:plastocyanin